MKPAGVGGGEARDPKMVAPAKVLQPPNDRVGYTDAHNESWLARLVI